MGGGADKDVGRFNEKAATTSGGNVLASFVLAGLLTGCVGRFADLPLETPHGSLLDGVVGIGAPRGALSKSTQSP